MYNKQIYDAWELHQDATQLEINYKFYVKIIETLDVDSLLQYTPNGKEIKITSEDIIRQWQTKRIGELFNQFENISSLGFPNNNWYHSSDVIISALFKSGFILNMLKTTNYKAQQSEIYYEPTMFRLASSILDIANFEEWMISLTNTILSSDSIDHKDVNFNIDWKVIVNERVKNTVWFLENLCLSFKDIFDWYIVQIKKMEIEQSATNSKKDSLNNILNHWVIYSLVDFYLKYIYDQNEKSRISFNKLYDVVLSLINEMIKNQTFAIIAFKSIAFFINQLIRLNVMKHDDPIVINFQNIVKITSSSKNKERLNEMMFDGCNDVPLSSKNDQFLNKEIYIARKFDKKKKD